MTKREILLSIILCVGILTQLSPQIRIILGPFFILFLSVTIYFGFLKRNIFNKTIKQFSSAIIAGLLFIALAAWRLNGYFSTKAILASFIVYPGIILMAMTALSALKNTNDRMRRNVKNIVFIGWTMSMALGIPVLISNPMAARYLTSHGFDEENSAFAIRGVGNFSVYMAFAVVFPILFNIVVQKKSGISKYLSLLLLLLAAVSVYLSSFAMASMILTVNIILYLLAYLVMMKKNKMITALLFCVIIGILGYHVEEIRSLDAIEKISDKISSFTKGISDEGLIYGDPTNRIYWLYLEMKTFIKSPIIGYIPENNNLDLPIYNHSSLGDFLSLFGLPIALLWIWVVYVYFWYSIKNTEKRFMRLGKKISIISFIAAGIMNPVWNNPVIVIGMAVFFLPEKMKQGRKSRENDYGKNKKEALRESNWEKTVTETASNKSIVAFKACKKGI